MATKCVIEWCSRPASTDSRLPFYKYCEAHRMRLKRLDSGQIAVEPSQYLNYPFAKPRGRASKKSIPKTLKNEEINLIAKRIRREVLDEVAFICEFWAEHFHEVAAKELGPLFRRLE